MTYGFMRETMTAVLTKDKLISTPDSNIYSVVNTRSNVSDPKDSSGGRVFVYKSDPFIKSSNFNGFPYVVVEGPRISYPSKSVDGKKKSIEWKQAITVVTASDGALVNVNADAGETNMNDILDDLNETFNDETVKQQLRNLRLYDMDLEVVNTDDTQIKDKTVHNSELELSYREVISVSS